MATTARPLLITLEYPPQVGGVANYYQSLISHFSIHCTVAHQLPQSWLRMIPWLYQQIKRHHYTHILVGQVLPLGTVAWIVSRFTGTPYIIFTHGMDVLIPQKSRRKRWLLRRILRQADHIISASQFTKNQIIKFDAQLSKLTVIHPAAVITPQLSAQPVPGIPSQFILSVGRLVERKGFDMVIQALSAWPQLHYVIAGSGADAERLTKLAQQSGVAERVQFLPHLNNQEIAYLYQQCLFLAMPARPLPDGDVEGFGIVVLEANRFGKVALGGSHTGMADAIQDGITGILVDGHDLASVSAGIKRLLNTVEREPLQLAAKRYSESQTWNQAAQQLLALLN